MFSTSPKRGMFSSEVERSHVFSGRQKCGMFTPETISVVWFLQKPKAWYVFSRSQKRCMFTPEAKNVAYFLWKPNVRYVFSRSQKRFFSFLFSFLFQKPKTWHVFSRSPKALYAIPYTPSHIPKAQYRFLQTFWQARYPTPAMCVTNIDLMRKSRVVFLSRDQI